MVVTGSTRNRFVSLIARHVGSNPTLSAREFTLYYISELARGCGLLGRSDIVPSFPLQARKTMLYAKSQGSDVFRSSGFVERCPSWPKERDWKSRVLPKVVPGVRIPLSPPPIPPKKEMEKWNIQTKSTTPILQYSNNN